MKRFYRGQIVLLIIMVIYACLMFVPLRWFWFAPGDFAIADTKPGEAAVISFDREILRDTRIRYTVTIRKVGKATPQCNASPAPFTYRTTYTLPESDDLNLDYWSDGDPKCIDLPPGDYVIQTCWTGYGLIWGLVPPKTECTDRHSFSSHLPQPVGPVIIIEDAGDE